MLDMIVAVAYATVVVGIVGLLIGILLGIAGSVFEVKIDEKEAAIRACLPGNNCGGCGFPGCDGCAHAIFLGEAKINQCPVGGAKVAAKIAEVMGVEEEPVVEEAEANKALIHKDGCVGCGLCARTCPCQAINVVREVRKAFVDFDKCVGCGACAAKCPKKTIEITPESQARAAAAEAEAAAAQA